MVVWNSHAFIIITLDVKCLHARFINDKIFPISFQEL